MNRWERELRRLARKSGSSLERTANQHWVILHPSGGRVIVSGSPSDRGNLRVVRGCVNRMLRGYVPQLERNGPMPEKIDRKWFPRPDLMADIAAWKAEFEALSEYERYRGDLEGCYYECLMVEDFRGAERIKQELNQLRQ